MRSYINYLVLLLAVVFTACPGSEIDEPEIPQGDKGKVELLKQKINEIVSEDVLKEAKSLGLPIYEGINSPIITGSYLLDDLTMKKSNVEDDHPVGTKYIDKILSISNQNNETFSLKLNVEAEGEVTNYNAIISGNNNKFTIYAPSIVKLSDGSSMNIIQLYSAELKDGELHNLYYGMFLLSKSYSGMGYVLFEEDGVCKKVSGDDNDDVEVTGDKATGQYNGSDLTFEFSSGLSVSINSANNKGASNGKVVVVESKDFPMMSSGSTTVLDFSETDNIYTYDIELDVPKDLDPDEDIACSLFTTDRDAAEATNGRIFKTVDFTYDKSKGKLKFTVTPNTPFGETKLNYKAKYEKVAIELIPDLYYSAEQVTMKAPYVEQLDNTCWAACAMMFIRSYTNLEPYTSNSYTAFVKDMGHKTLDQGWNTNFFTFWEYDTRTLKKSIERMVGGDLSVSSSSFRRTKYAANEMVRLLKKKHPVILNHGTHVLYVIGYKRVHNGGSLSFLVHDPQGVEGDMYKWIDWDDYLKKIKFNESLFRGDAMYLLYGNKPMLEDPILQTISFPTADTDNRMCPQGSDFTFTMQAYNKARKVFPKYDLNGKNGLSLGIMGYDDNNKSNDTIYSPARLNVAMKVFNADDKAAPMILDMYLDGKVFLKSYEADFSVPANGSYTVKNDNFKYIGKPFDASLTELFEIQGNPSMDVSFNLRRPYSGKEIYYMVYPEVTLKSISEKEPKEFIAFRNIIKDIYTSATGKQWSDGDVWLEKTTDNYWGYNIFHKSLSSLMFGVHSTYDGQKYFTIYLKGKDEYGNNVKVANHPMPDGWTWELNATGYSKEIEITNDYLREVSSLFGNDHLQKLTISSANSCRVSIERSVVSSAHEKITVDFKQTEVNLNTKKIKKIFVESAKSLSLTAEDCEGGQLSLIKAFPVTSLNINANNFSVVGNGDTGTSRVTINKGSSTNAGIISLSNISCSRLDNDNVFMKELECDQIRSESTIIDGDYFGNNTNFKKLTIKNSANLKILSIKGNYLETIDVNSCSNLKTLKVDCETLVILNVTGSSNIEEANLVNCIKLGGYLSQWPSFLSNMYYSGKGKGILVSWRYYYWREYDESGDYEYVMNNDRGFGFYMDSSEPGSVDIEKYRTVGFDYY